MELRKSEAILEKSATRSFVISLFSRMLQQQPPSDIIQVINETMEVAETGHSSVASTVAVDRAIRILLVTHWARSTFSTDVSAAYKLLLQHAKGLNNSATAPPQRGNVTPGLDGALFNFVIEKLIESFFLNTTVANYVTQRISRRQTDAVSFPSFHCAVLACQIAKDIANISVKLYGAVQDRRISPKALTEQLRAVARAMSCIGSALPVTTQSGSFNALPAYAKTQETIRTNNYSNVLSDCLAQFRPSKIVLASSGKSDVPLPADKVGLRPVSSRPSDITEKPMSSQAAPDTTKILNVHDFTLAILEIFFILY